MARIHSVLWVGSADALDASALPDAPNFDVVFERDADAACAQPLASFDAIVLDARDPARAGPALDALCRAGARAPVWVRLGAGAREASAELRARGADDVFERITPELLASRLEDRAIAPQDTSAAGAVGASGVMQRLLAQTARAARSRANVLVTGETGTGKELLARALHEQSARRRQRFVALNCAALPDTLLESELLGHVRGAFTGAERDRRGLFEEADGGTLFLDEVAETSPAFQVKLLRVLQEQSVRPVGGNRERRVDVRVVAATHRNVAREVAAGRFREDLFYRLAVLTLSVPPLRERIDDLRPLAAHFLALHGHLEGKPGCRLSPEALALLEAHAWPGNVRELENAIQHALTFAEPGETLGREHFAERLGNALAPLGPVLAQAAQDEPLRASVARVEAWLLRRALEAEGGCRAATARRLGLTREGLYKKMKRLGIA
ncbi:MAG TPA: sigma 54-interacting transcriptional regulator [Myxococcota bacterium]|nr:sigma 54-interacting transcriptional regulator [Myxococcota bacterium]